MSRADDLAAAQARLDDALVVVARTANEMTFTGTRAGYVVDDADMVRDLREALQEWREATQAYLAEASK